jgi:hypothetical protein
VDFSKLNAGDAIYYLGDSWEYNSNYKVVTAESTYTNPDIMPEHEKGKLMIVHLTNSDLALFWTLDRLDPKEWSLEPKKAQ